MTRPRKIGLAVLLFALVAAAFLARILILPKPQSQFAEGLAAPDFTLNDQDGHAFTLSGLRGSRVVLVFYRGYW